MENTANSTPRYVEALFDDDAADFHDVVDSLGYRGFEVLVKPFLDAEGAMDMCSTSAVARGCAGR